MEDDRTLVLTRHLAAPVARVWQAWTDPEILPHWFGPEGWTCDTHHIDLREGGEWRFTMAGHGMSFANRHRYTRWVPGERIEQIEPLKISRCCQLQEASVDHVKLIVVMRHDRVRAHIVRLFVISRNFAEIPPAVFVD